MATDTEGTVSPFQCLAADGGRKEGRDQAEGGRLRVFFGGAVKGAVSCS